MLKLHIAMSLTLTWSIVLIALKISVFLRNFGYS